MFIPSSLELILIVIILFLSFLLIYRIRREKKQFLTIKQMSLEDFSDFLRTNSIKGTILDVAKKVSDLLVSSFGCEKIIFVRKKRGVLELNYYHGIRSFNRSDFRFRYGSDLAKLLKADFFPRHINELKEFLSERFYNKIKQYKMDVFFPVFWRDNLYGIYFIRSTIETQSPSFNLLIASLAQSLSAAYHIKWHESKYETLLKKVENTEQPAFDNNNEEHLGRFLKLVRNRNTETIIPELMDTFKSVTGANALAYIYAPTDDIEEPMLLKDSIEGLINVPDNQSLNDIIKSFEQKTCYDLDNYTADCHETENWLKGLREKGLKYIASFPLTPNRGGLIAWQGGKSIETVERQLEFFKSHTFDLVENAESFEKIEEMSYTDNLTGLANQRYFFKRLDEEINRAKRFNRKLAMIIFDLDDLKYINDTYGHLAGDSLLSQMGEILRKSIRTIDVIARYGGDEFCVIMPEADKDTCLKFMERLQSKIFHSKFTAEGIEKSINCTISIGGAIFPDHAQDAKKLIFAADMVLLKAKETGRNKFLIYSENLDP